MPCDLNNLHIEHLKLLSTREKQVHYTSQFLRGLQLIITCRTSLPKVAADIVKKRSSYVFALYLAC